MHFFEIFLFIAKYTPFWAVPVSLTAIHFAYIYWLKDYRGIAYIWGAIVLFCLTSIVAYFALGGPDQIMQTITQYFQ